MYSSDICLVVPFSPEFGLSYIRMVVVPMGRCRVFVVVLVPPIVLLAYVCSATSKPGHHGVTTIYNLHHPGCC